MTEIQFSTLIAIFSLSIGLLVGLEIGMKRAAKIARSIPCVVTSGEGERVLDAKAKYWVLETMSTIAARIEEEM